MFVQAEAVLGMALRRLTSLEAGKLEAEAKELAERIAELQVRCRMGAACCRMGKSAQADLAKSPPPLESKWSATSCSF